MSEIPENIKAAIDSALEQCPPNHKVLVAFEKEGVRISYQPKDE